MEVRPGTLGFCEIQASRDLLDRECRLLTQAGCERQLGGMALGSRRQIVRRPTRPKHSPPHVWVAFGLSIFERGRAGVFFPHFPPHLHKTSPPKGFAADRPALPKLLESFLVHFL